MRFTSLLATSLLIASSLIPKLAAATATSNPNGEMMEIPIVELSSDQRQQEREAIICSDQGKALWTQHNLRIQNFGPDYRVFQDTEYDENAFDEQQLLLVKNEKSQIRVEVLATRVGYMPEVTLDSIDGNFRAYLKDLKVKKLETGRKKFGDLEWNTYTFRSRYSNKTALDQRYQTYRNGYLYTLYFWSFKGESNHEEIKAESERIASKIEFADENRFTYVEGLKAVETLANPSLGISLDLKDQRLAIGEEVSTENDAHWFCFSPTDAMLVTFNPILLGPNKLSMNEVVRGFEVAIGGNFSSDREKKQRSFKVGDYTCKEFAGPWTNEEGQVAQVVIRIIKGQKSALLLNTLSYAHSLDTVKERADAYLETLVFKDPVEPPPTSPAIAEFQSGFYNGVGVFNFQQGNPNKATRYFQESYNLKPDLLGVAVNLAHTLLAQGKIDEALQICETELAKNSDNLRLLSIQGSCYFQIGRTQEAIESYRKLIFEYGVSADETLNEYYSLLFSRGENKTLYEDVSKAEEMAGQTLAIRYWKIVALRDNGNLDQALELSEELVSNIPDNYQFAELHVDVLLKVQENAAALEYCHYAIEELGLTQMRYYEAVCHLAMQRYASAKDSLDACLAAYPAHAQAMGLLSQIHTLMGGTDPSLFSNPIPAVPYAETIDQLELAVDQERLSRKGAYAVMHGLAYEFHKNQRQRKTLYQLFKVLDEDAVLELSELEQSFNPNFERIYVNEAKVLSEDGEVLAEADPSQFYLTNNEAESIVSEKRNLHIPFPGVRKGCLVKLVLTYETNQPVEEFQFANPVISGIFPRRVAFAQVNGDIDSLSYQSNLDDFVFEKSDNSLLWYIPEPNSYDRVEHQPDSKLFLPTVWIGPAEKSWQTLGDTYYSEIESQLTETDSRCGDIVKDLDIGDGNERQKVDALFKYISDQYTYKALLFGPRSTQPNQIGKILTNRYGDCKDHTVLALHLLREMGIEAWPALVDTNRQAIAEVPSLYQFNHMILYVPSIEENPFIDPTDYPNGKSYRPRYLDDQIALIVTPKGSSLKVIGGLRPEDNQMEINRAVKFTDTKEIEVHEKVTAHGHSAAFIRQFLRGAPDNERITILQSYLRLAEPSLYLSNLEVQNLDTPQLPIELDYSYTADKSFASEGGTLRGRAPSTWDNLVFYNERSTEPRRIPFRINSPVEISLQLDVSVPESFHFSRDELLQTVEASSSFGAVVRTAHQTGAHTSFDYQITLNGDTYASDRYEDYIEHAENAKRLLAPDLVLSKKPL
ncbi:DUF3857 domain-containing protein [Pelagicoccus albus]|uniref:DUF3857 domain-containing protein n=1 Tax=Pelagicoccus albus TaxID=415222 RepID=A0A7X1E6Y3_9BACT|nr:DUF3857 domain-containing protein [Pelagicoccus albus]MBC2604759.1 DUF3857 domain-containing protein [Pelagicoccus albus]